MQKLYAAWFNNGDKYENHDTFLGVFGTYKKAKKYADAYAEGYRKESIWQKGYGWVQTLSKNVPER